MPVDPVRYIVNKKGLMEPPPNDENNRLLYVIGLEEDGFVRDVTRRYAKEFNSKTLKARLSNRNGRKGWWDDVISMFTRKYELVCKHFTYAKAMILS